MTQFQPATIPVPPIVDPKLIPVYVREGESEVVRTLSFNPPSEISQGELLESGYAIDGRAAIRSVTAHDPAACDMCRGDLECDDLGMSLLDQLLDAERELSKWLGKKGYRVEFR